MRNRTARSEGLSVYAVKAFRLLTYIKKRTDFLYALLLSILKTLFVKTLKKSDFLPIYNKGTQIELLVWTVYIDESALESVKCTSYRQIKLSIFCPLFVLYSGLKRAEKDVWKNNTMYVGTALLCGMGDFYRLSCSVRCRIQFPSAPPKQQNMEEWLNNADCSLHRTVKPFFSILGYSM